MKKIDMYDQVFLPGSPIKDERYLVGREQEIKDLRNALDRPGQHAIVIGDRGVGKTSLVLQVLASREYRDMWRTCDPGSSFSIVFEDLLRDCGVDFRQIEETIETDKGGELKAGLGIEISAKGSKKSAEKTVKYPPKELQPWKIFVALRELKSKLILVLDEYDAIHRSKDPAYFHQSTAYTMKHLSDHNHSCDSRIVVVGVASSSVDLLGKHESIQRSAREIYLRPLTRANIYDFFTMAESELGIHFEYKVKSRLAYASLGFPFFIHLVGLECIEAMLRRSKDARVVRADDYNLALNKAVDKAFRAELTKYSTIYKSANTTERAVIDTLALMKQRAPKRKMLRDFVSKNEDIDRDTFNEALFKLTQEKHFLFLSRKTDDVRFMDPLMRVFLRERLLLNKKKKNMNSASQSDFFDG